MPRPYSPKFRALLEKKSKVDSLGMDLARLCVKTNLPAMYVAVALETSATTVYSWFRGQGIREFRRKRVEAFMGLVEADLKNKVLPAKTLPEAKRYIENMIGVEI